MIPDSKKEEIREAADIVEVVEDYVKLKRSGRSYKGLCPFHDENTPSFHVTPDLGIYKCFGCGESGDVFNFVMEMDGIGFVEAMRTLAERFGVSLPEEEAQEFDEEHNLREGIYHALRYAGVYYYRQLVESDEAEQARQYLQNRGYNRHIMQKFGLGYAPRGGEKLYKAAVDSGLNDEYLLEAGLIKPSKRGSGYYDTFRGRLMFPIFNPSGKVIAFAGRVLGNEKTAKYINSPQTKVYNKSEVLYGVNFAKGGIRKTGNVLLVEGYTDVITLHQHDIENVVASSGTSLTRGQMHLLHRYGDAITMLYDSDSAGQRAMKRGINIALAEGMDVKLLELPEGEDPDSFVRQFGKESFLELKQESSEDFVSFLVNKAQREGILDDTTKVKPFVDEVLNSIAEISDEIKRQIYVRQLHKMTQEYTADYDRDLMGRANVLRAKKLEEREKQKERAQKREERKRRQQQEQAPPPPHQPDDHTRAFEQQVNQAESREKPRKSTPVGKKPNYEKELIRLMLMYERPMIDYIGSLCNEQQFEDEELKAFYLDIIERYKEEKEISVQVYADREHPYPQLVGEIALEEHSVSERHSEKTGVQYKRDKNPYMTAKGALKALKIHYLDRLQRELYEKYQACETAGERKKVMRTMKEVGRQRTLLQQSTLDELFPDPESDEGKSLTKKTFEYKMKGEK
ncbi:DNA primase [Halalkalibaculum sp. DA3122]|uniref:DNA primase n=1 Tax=Halalkalibaculum sp. DA3122 TaxID=3373607 RepID=UPI0037540DCF